MFNHCTYKTVHVIAFQEQGELQVEFELSKNHLSLANFYLPSHLLQFVSKFLYGHWQSLWIPKKMVETVYRADLLNNQLKLAKN